MDRQNVYKLIDGEREYQEALPPTRTDGREHPVADFVVMLEYYTSKAVEAWTMNAGDDAALDVIRKIAGICVHCMEHYGAPPRKAEK
jgi:hypothetical protein